MRTRDLIRQLNRTKKDLDRFKKEIPDKEIYITVHCICLDTIKELNQTIKDIKYFLKDARKEDKKNG
jgi:hypothetical protein